MMAAGAPAMRLAVSSVAPTILRVGSEDKTARWLPPILKGEIDFAVAYSEPDAGTDLASLKTRAALDGDEWVIDGQKIWNTGAHTASHNWVAVRTEPEAPKHKGISMMIVPMDRPGITVQPLWTWSGIRANAVFFEDVRVPRDHLVGERGMGFYYAMMALDFERIMIGSVGMIRRLLDELIAFARRRRRDGRPLGSIAWVRRALADLQMRLEVGRQIGLLNAWLIDPGGGPAKTGSVARVGGRARRGLLGGGRAPRLVRLRAARGLRGAGRVAARPGVARRGARPRRRALRRLRADRGRARSRGARHAGAEARVAAGHRARRDAGDARGRGGGRERRPCRLRDPGAPARPDPPPRGREALRPPGRHRRRLPGRRARRTGRVGRTRPGRRARRERQAAEDLRQGPAERRRPEGREAAAERARGPPGHRLAALHGAAHAARCAPLRRHDRRRRRGPRDDDPLRLRARAVWREARHLPGGAADGRRDGDRARGRAARDPPGALAPRRGAAGGARGRGREGVDGPRLPRGDAHRPPAPRRRGLRDRARAAPLLGARQGGRAALRLDRGVARGARRRAPARTRRGALALGDLTASRFGIHARPPDCSVADLPPPRRVPHQGGLPRGPGWGPPHPASGPP